MVRIAQPFSGEVQIDAGPVMLPGYLEIPALAPGVVLFAHGSGSGRFSSRNQHVARLLREGGLGTLLFDLLTESEAASRASVFNIPLLASRLAAASDWLRRQHGLAVAQSGGDDRAGPTSAAGRLGPHEPPRIGYFGASTGAGAALLAAADDPTVAAVVSRGGRPDLAGRALPGVRSPTLLLVGGNDLPVIDLNREAYAELTCPKQLVIVPRATHLFEEPGTLDEVARLALDWFSRHF